jgi:hypothetical protein
VDVLTPYALITAQATKLTEKTQGLVEGRVNSRREGAGLICHTFDLYAPVLTFRYTLFRLWHQEAMVYPVLIFGGREKMPSPSDIATYLAGRAMGGIDPIWTEEQLVNALQNAFTGPQVVPVIHSLIARSNEVRVGAAPVLEAEEVAQTGQESVPTDPSPPGGAEE